MLDRDYREWNNKNSKSLSSLYIKRYLLESSELQSLCISTLYFTAWVAVEDLPSKIPLLILLCFQFAPSKIYTLIFLCVSGILYTSKTHEFCINVAMLIGVYLQRYFMGHIEPCKILSPKSKHFPTIEFRNTVVYQKRCRVLPEHNGPVAILFTNFLIAMVKTAFREYKAVIYLETGKLATVVAFLSILILLFIISLYQSSYYEDSKWAILVFTAVLCGIGITLDILICADVVYSLVGVFYMPSICYIGRGLNFPQHYTWKYL